MRGTAGKHFQMRVIANATGYKGVHPHHDNKHGTTYRAEIKYQKQTYTLGTYLDALSAAYAYNIAAKQYYGENAWQNSIPEGFVPSSPTEKSQRIRSRNG